MKINLHSGGAEGADVLFGELAEKAGHEVKHYSFAGHYAAEKGRSHCIMLTLFELKEADPHLLKANETLKRKFPTSHFYMDNLLRRNYYQVKSTNRVYAISTLEKDEKRVKGGTGWAVQMAVDLKVPEIYVYDQEADGWFKYSYEEKKFVPHFRMDVPKPDGDYTGIGSRELNKLGAEAIRRLYE